MKSSKQLYDERAVIEQKQRDLISKCEAKGVELVGEDAAQFNAWDDEYKSLTTQIATAEKVEALKASKGSQVKDPVSEPQTDEEKQAQYSEIFSKWMKYGMGGLKTEEKRIIAQHTRGTDPQTTTPNSAGGYLIPQGFSNRLQEEMALWGGMLENVDVFRTATGNQVDWPTVDDTGATGALLAEGSTMPVNDITFGQKQLDAYMYTSGVVKVSEQLLQDSAFNIEDMLVRQFGRRLGTIINAHLTTGTGSSQPNGVVTAASVGTTTAVNTTPTRSEIVNLVHSVDPAYRNGALFCMNDSSLALIKKLAFGTGDDRPLWQPSMRVGEPDRLEGYGYFVNQDMPSFGAGNKPVAFGDFKGYVARLAGGTVFRRLDERYADELMVGFLAYQRADGELIAANSIKTMRNPTT